MSGQFPNLPRWGRELLDVLSYIDWTPSRHLAIDTECPRASVTVVLGTAMVSPNRVQGMDYFPLSIDYEEKMYAAGKISGSRFIKREGRAVARRIVVPNAVPMFARQRVDHITRHCSAPRLAVAGP